MGKPTGGEVQFWTYPAATGSGEQPEVYGAAPEDFTPAPGEATAVDSSEAPQDVALLASNTCARCGGIGHWAAQCPSPYQGQRRGPPPQQKGQPKAKRGSRPAFHVLEETPSAAPADSSALRAAIAAVQSWMLLTTNSLSVAEASIDTGCGISCVEDKTLAAFSAEYPDQILKREPCRSGVTFGDGLDAEVRSRVLLKGGALGPIWLFGQSPFGCGRAKNADSISYW